MIKRLFLLVILVPALFAVSASALDEVVITQEDIDEGIKFCEEFPVRLSVDGEEIIFDGYNMPPIIVKERTLIPVRALFEKLGGIVHWDEERQGVEIHMGDSFVSLYIGSNVAWVNGYEEPLEVPAMIIAKEGEEYGSTMIPVRFTAEALGFTVGWKDEEREVVILSPGETPDGEDNKDNSEEPVQVATGAAISFWAPFDYEPLGMLNEAASQKLIAIDIGHGGRDVGAIGNENKPDELYEKDVNLKIGLLLRDHLMEAGANIYMIRERDIGFTLAERAEAANNAGAVLFVSVHNNSSEFYWPTGTEVHYYSKVDEEGRDEKELFGIYSKDVARSVQDEMLKALGTFDRGIKNSPWMGVLRRTDMPAIVIEGAFLSNADDFEMIKTDEYIRRYAYATAKGIIAVMNETFTNNAGGQ